MLQGIETEVGEVRGLFIAMHPEDTAFIVKAIRAMDAFEGFELFGRESIEWATGGRQVVLGHRGTGGLPGSVPGSTGPSARGLATGRIVDIDAGRVKRPVNRCTELAPRLRAGSIGKITENLGRLEEQIPEHQVVHRRQSQQRRIDPIEHTTHPREQRPGVLYLGVAFEK